MKKATILGKYLLLERLNVGGMAEVFLAKGFGAEGLERYAAIKKILPSMAEDEEFIRMFIDEARISVQLNHANIVHIHDLDKAGDSHYIAMEYVAGKDVRTLLERFRKRGTPMPVPQAVFIASRMCEGLHYAHTKKDARGQELGIIHRDVSPQNILISYEGEVKIIDFGIAKAANRSQKTQAGILKGKFGYMSPEMVRGQPIDRRSDIFAMGVILYELLTGEKLFTGESDYSVLEKVRNAQVPVPREMNPAIPAGLERVLLKALAREPTDRYQWAADLQEDLIRFLLVGDQIYTSKHLSDFMKAEFAEEIAREAAAMERYATVERPEELSGNPPALTPAPRPVVTPPQRTVSSTDAFGIDSDAEDGVDKTQLLDHSAIDALDLDAPADGGEDLNEATRFDAVNPFGHEVSSSPSGKAVVGDVVYSGATVVGAVPTTTQSDLPAATEATRLFPTDPDHGRQDLAEQTDPRRSLETRSGSPNDDAPTHDGLDAPEPTRAVRPSGPKGRSKPTRALHDETAAVARPSRASAQAAFDDLEGESTDDGSDVPDEATGSVSRPGPLAKAPARPMVPPKWIPLAGISAGALLLIVVLFALVHARSGDKTQDLMIRVLSPAQASVTVDGQPVQNGAVSQVKPGTHEIVASAKGFLPEHRTVAVVAGRMPPVVELSLHPEHPADDEDTGGQTGTDAAAQNGAEGSGSAAAADQGAGEAKDTGTAGANGAVGANGAAASNDAAAANGATAQSGSGQPSDHAGSNDSAQANAGTVAAAKTFSARFDSDADGVTVEIDGKRAGQAPGLEVPNLTVGKTYRYTATRAGFRTKSGTFSSGDGGDVTVALALEKLPAPSSSHHAKTVSVPHTVSAHATRTSHGGARSKVLGRLAASTHPAGAEIWVDNRPTGRHTPVAPGSPLMLPVGTHQVVFKLGSKRSPAQRVTIDENETTKLINVPLE